MTSVVLKNALRERLDTLESLWSRRDADSIVRELYTEITEIAGAGSDALYTLPTYHTFNHRSNPAAIELAEKLLAIAPVPMSKAFFANSGSEANDTAVKLVWYYHNAIGKPAKKKIVARRNAYHGVTVASASLGGLPALFRAVSSRWPSSSAGTPCGPARRGCS